MQFRVNYQNGNSGISFLYQGIGSADHECEHNRFLKVAICALQKLERSQ